MEEGNHAKTTHWCEGPSQPSVARCVYGLIFLASSVLAWTVRDYGHAALSELQRLQGCDGAEDCLGAEGVLRISLGCFVFFLVMFASTAGTKSSTEARSSWHLGWWLPKTLLWLASMTIPFFLPSRLVFFYGKMAHFAAGVFLFIQLLSVISLIRWLNDCCWRGRTSSSDHHHSHRWRVQVVTVVVVSTVAYAASLSGIVLMYIWYAPNTSCHTNIFFVSVTLALILLTTFVSIHPKVKAGFLTPGLMGVYLVFICWCALRSEPYTEMCGKRARAATHSRCLTIISFVMALLAIVVATFTTAVDSTCLQMMKVRSGVEEEEAAMDVPRYGYGFFHFVFATGAAYLGMLFVGWNAHEHTSPKWRIDVGWVSTWVRVVNEWLSALVYLWVMISPSVDWKSLRGCFKRQESYLI